MVRRSHIPILLAAIAIAFAMGRYTGRTGEPARGGANVPPALPSTVESAHRAVAPSALAEENGEARQAAAANRLNSPDPAMVAGEGRPRRWQRRHFDQFVRDMERRGSDVKPLAEALP